MNTADQPLGMGKNLADRQGFGAKPPLTPPFSAARYWYSVCHSVRRMLGPLGADLERYMDLLSARQKLVASNIANLDTPGYRTQDIDFQSEFENAVAGPVHPQAVQGLAVRNDGNNVSIDRETRMLAENALRFQTASGLLHSQIQMVRAAIKEGLSG